MADSSGAPEGAKKPKVKKLKKNIQSGIAHITASFNNTIVTIVLLNDAVMWAMPLWMFFLTFLTLALPLEASGAPDESATD
jgi:hypothetical protein